MLKITVRYLDEAELQRYLCTVHHYIVKCKPPLTQPGRKGPESDYYRRDIWLKTEGTKAENPSNSGQNPCHTPI